MNVYGGGGSTTYPPPLRENYEIVHNNPLVTFQVNLLETLIFYLAEIFKPWNYTRELQFMKRLYVVQKLRTSLN